MAENSETIRLLEADLIAVREELIETRKARYDVAKDAACYMSELCYIREQLAEYIEKPEDPTWVLVIRATRKITQQRQESFNAERNP